MPTQSANAAYAREGAPGATINQSYAIATCMNKQPAKKPTKGKKANRQDLQKEVIMYAANAHMGGATAEQTQT